jgi:hypothetical protein
MPITQVLTAPTAAPSRTQDKTTFDTNVENRLAWDATNVTELTTWTGQVNGVVAGVTADAATVAASLAAAAASAATATTQASNASASAATATTQASNASTSATNAAASFDAFDDIYLGSKASNPTLDNDGNPLQTGALYWNNVSSEMRVYSGVTWAAAYLPASGYATSGVNLNITSLIGLTTPLSIAQGGTGSSSTAYASLTTNVTGILPVAKGGTGVATTGISGNILVSNGTSWVSTPQTIVEDNSLLMFFFA